MTVKKKPHHALVAIKAKFATVATLEITGSATRSAMQLGYSLEDIVDVVAALEPGDFVKSETAHSPPRPGVWHDTYHFPGEDHDLYLKFAGETLIDVVLASFKEV